MAVPLLLAPSGRPARGVRLALEPLLDRYRIVRGGRLRRAPLSQIATFARGSRAWDFDAAGNLATYEADVPRNGYSGGQRAGWPLEGQSTNYIRNPRCEGAVIGTVGSGGALPTNWSQSQGTGIAPQILGFGVDGGIPYVDIRFAGSVTATSNNNIFLENYTAIPAADAQVWSQSCYLAVIGGSLSNISSVRLHFSTRTSAGGTVAVDIGGVVVPTTAPLGNQRLTPGPRTISGTTIAYVQPQLQVNPVNGASIDLTLRVGLPTFEQSYCITSPNMPAAGSPAATVRAQDRFSIGGDAFLQVFDAAAPEGFLFVDVMLPQVAGSVSQHIASLATGSAFTNRIMLWNPSSAGTLGFFSSSGQQASPFTFTPGVPFRIGMTWGGGSAAIASEGVSYEYSSVTPPSLDTLWIGQIGSGNFSPNGRYRGVWAGRKKQSINAFRAASVSGADIEAIFGAAA